MSEALEYLLGSLTGESSGSPAKGSESGEATPPTGDDAGEEGGESPTGEEDQGDSAEGEKSGEAKPDGDSGGDPPPSAEQLLKENETLKTRLKDTQAAFHEKAESVAELKRKLKDTEEEGIAVDPSSLLTEKELEDLIVDPDAVIKLIAERAAAQTKKQLEEKGKKVSELQKEIGDHDKAFETAQKVSEFVDITPDFDDKMFQDFTENHVSPALQREYESGLESDFTKTMGRIWNDAKTHFGVKGKPAAEAPGLPNLGGAPNRGVPDLKDPFDGKTAFEALFG